MLIEKEQLLNAYDTAHKGPPGGARKLIEEAPAVNAVPIDQMGKMLAYLFQGCPSKAHPAHSHFCHPLCACSMDECMMDQPADAWTKFLTLWIDEGCWIPSNLVAYPNDPLEGDS